jgi:transcriptional regulator with XRE-family HTH domain
MRIGELIGLAREIKGWTLRELERETGISNALLSQIETGHVKDPSFTKVVRICEALGLPLDRAAECASLKRLKEILRKKTT